MTTRGIRNNNPGNLRISEAKWLGKITPSKDVNFEEFDSAIHGIRAAGVVIRNYYKLHKLQTITQIIDRWAPGSENDTSSYIASVAKQMATGANDVLDIMDPNVLASLLAAIITHENGSCPYSPEDILEAAMEALSGKRINQKDILPSEAHSS